MPEKHPVISITKQARKQLIGEVVRIMARPSDEGIVYTMMLSDSIENLTILHEEKDITVVSGSSSEMFIHDQLEISYSKAHGFMIQAA